MEEHRRHLAGEYEVVVLGATIAGVGGAVAASRAFGKDKVLLLESGGEIGGEYLSTYRPVSGLEDSRPVDPLARQLLQELKERRAIRDGILQPVTLLPVLSHLLKKEYPPTLYNTRLLGLTPAPMLSGREGWQMELYMDGELTTLRCATVFDTTRLSDSCRSLEESPSEVWFHGLVQLPGSGRDPRWFQQVVCDELSLCAYAIEDYWTLCMKLEEDSPALGRDRMFQFWKSRPTSMESAVLVAVASQAERVYSGVPVRADEGNAKRMLLPEGYASDPIAALDKGICLMESLVGESR